MYQHGGEISPLPAFAPPPPPVSTIDIFGETATKAKAGLIPEDKVKTKENKSTFFIYFTFLAVVRILLLTPSFYKTLPILT
jgi:hypothetical protein